MVKGNTKLNYKCKCGKILFKIPKSKFKIDEELLFFEASYSDKNGIWYLVTDKLDDFQILHKKCYNRIWRKYKKNPSQDIKKFFYKEVKYEGNKKKK
jgi:hypothetical protein